MRGTFTLPSGRKVRIFSQRRFVVVIDNPTADAPYVYYRTDVAHRARERATHEYNAFVVDTAPTTDTTAITAPGA